MTLPIPTGMHGLLGPNGAGKSRILATLQEPDGGNVRLVIPTKLCVLDAATPAKRHRAQQFTGGKNIGVPATFC